MAKRGSAPQTFRVNGADSYSIDSKLSEKYSFIGLHGGARVAYL